MFEKSWEGKGCVPSFYSMCNRSHTPGARGACIRITLIFLVQAAIITTENTIGFQPTPEIERTIFFVSLHNELDIVICVHRTSETATAHQWRVDSEVPTDCTMTCLLLNR